jgi:hypothetical protein
MSSAAPNETETPHQQKIRLQNERRRRQSEQRQQKHEQQRLEQQEHAVVTQMPIALRSIHAQTLVAKHDCGSKSVVCSASGAKMRLQEKVSQSMMTNIRFTMCCNNGVVQLPLLQEPPEVLRRLLSGSNPRSRAFCEKIRMYNSILSFTSTGARIHESVTGMRGVYAFHIQGEMYHRIGSLLP